MQPSTPRAGLADPKQHLRSDLASGFLVFLVALPLSLAVAQASGFPLLSGIFTSIIGGLFVPFLGGAKLTIKGPATGLVVVAAGAVQELGHGDAWLGYQLTLAVVVVAGVVQILLGLLRTGVLDTVVQSVAVRGLLAAIGLTIVVQQVFPLLGAAAIVPQAFDAVEQLPRAIRSLNPEVAFIGLGSLLLLVALPRIPGKFGRKIPAPMLVIVVAVGLGHYFNFSFHHTYLFASRYHELGPAFLASVPAGLLSGVQFPEFSQIFSGPSLKYIVLFALVGTLESLMTTKAAGTQNIRQGNPDLDRDLLAVGIGNVLAGLVGGLPMVSEKARSSANAHGGGQTRWSGFFQGLFLLAFVVLVPRPFQRIPLAALAALLVYSGWQLAWPRELWRANALDNRQWVVFLATFRATLLGGLFLGLAGGALVEGLMRFFSRGRRVSVRHLFRADVEVEKALAGDGLCCVRVHKSAVFGNFHSLKKALDGLPRQHRIVVDFSDAHHVDQAVLEDLARYRTQYLAESPAGTFDIVGLDSGPVHLASDAPLVPAKAVERL